MADAAMVVRATATSVNRPTATVRRGVICSRVPSLRGKASASFAIGYAPMIRHDRDHTDSD
jgi:hypothetical protein